MGHGQLLFKAHLSGRTSAEICTNLKVPRSFSRLQMSVCTYVSVVNTEQNVENGHYGTVSTTT